MYLLTRIRVNGDRSPSMVSRKKHKLEKYLKENGYYFSKKYNAYIDDRNIGVEGGSGCDYVIEPIKEI